MALDCFEYNQHFVAMMNVINAARLNPPAEGQKHHIIPRCWFKRNNIKVDNSKNNLVLLSLEDHIKVHKLAILCSKDKYIKNAMIGAVNIITKQNIFKINGKNNIRYGIKLSEETKRKISEAQKGKKRAPLTIEHKNKVSMALKGKKKKPFSKSHIENLRLSHLSIFGKKLYEHYGYIVESKVYKREYRYNKKYGKCSWEK